MKSPRPPPAVPASASCSPPARARACARRVPKALHAVAGRPMLAHALAALREAGASAIAVVVGPERDDVAAEARAFAPEAEVFVQSERRGTAHAVLAARAAIARGYDDVLVVYADTPLMTAPSAAAPAPGAGRRRRISSRSASRRRIRPATAG